MHAARAPHLAEKHGAELAGADQADGHGTAGGLPFEQQGVQIHGTISVVIARTGGRSSSRQFIDQPQRLSRGP
jgi:hypothetical protein